MSEILDDFLVRQEKGFYCRYGDFHIDPQMPVHRAVISHAHGDHATPGHAYNYCTPATVAFMTYRFSKMHLHHIKTYGFGDSFDVGGVQIQFIPAGHMLGSAQILMEYGGVRYLYSGDIKLQADPTCEPLVFVQADVLITESTFADPDVKHPHAEDEILKLNRVEENIMLGAYALGKSQRLTALINQYCPDKDLLIHHGIAPLHRIYASFDIPLGTYGIYNRKEMKDPQKNKIYMVPPMTFRSYVRAKNTVRVFASGWKHLQKNNALSLFISDHVDWPDLLHYIQQVQPRELWTVHGEGKHLAAHFASELQVKSLH